MAICVSCLTWCAGSVCKPCSTQLGQVPPITLPGGIEVVTAYDHRGVARRLIHRLKYDGLTGAGDVFAEALATRIPADVSALVPVPRSVVRRVCYGIDPALTLARLLARRTGLPVVAALRAPLWWPRHAGSDRGSRKAPRFALAGKIPAGSALVDDVLTTGATIAAAAKVAGITTAVTATRAGNDLPG